MYKTQVTYNDIDGNERTDTLYFRFSEAEVTEMQFSQAGGYGTMLQQVIDAQDTPTIMKIFKKFILDSYGEKSPDGRGFIKVRDGHRLSEEFEQTEAYSQFFMRLFTDMNEAAAFFNGIFPKDLLEKARESAATKGLTDNPTTQKMIDAVNAKLKDSGNK